MGRAVALSPLRTQIRRSMRPAFPFLFAAWLCAGSAAAQDASPYVPLQHWAMPYVEQLIAAGVIADPTPLTPPLKRSHVARALQTAHPTALSSAARGMMRRLQFDPDWYGRTDNASAFPEAYASAQWRQGEVFYGALARNWGPSGVQGVLLSDSPYSLDHLYVTFGTSRVRYQVIATQLDTRTDATGAAVNRYMSVHRLWVRPPGRWTLAVWDGGVWSGVGRPFEPWFLNPTAGSYIRQSNTGTNVNSFLGFDVERRAAATVFAQFMLDDIQVSRRVPSDLKPTSYAFTVGAKGRVRSAAAAWTLFYTQVANLTYRNEDDFQVPLYHLLGTGRNFSDYDQATLKVGLLARPGLLLEPELTLLRQGEGDPRLPHPLVPAYPSTATLFQGVVERTVRLALGGSWPPGGFQLTGNGGVHLIHNAGHVRGTSDTRWVGALRVTYRVFYQNALP